eukprot:3103717-Rhodomonas_salina.2
MSLFMQPLLPCMEPVPLLDPPLISHLLISYGCTPQTFVHSGRHHVLPIVACNLHDRRHSLCHLPLLATHLQFKVSGSKLEVLQRYESIRLPSPGI